MKKRLSKEGLIPRLLAITLLLFCIIWSGWRAVESAQHSSLLSTYQNEVEKLNSATYDQLKKEAIKYNDVLYQTQGLYIPGLSDTHLSDEAYKKTLTVGSSEVMARINIPKINLKLPIYHGTSDEVLANGIGHLSTSSLPVGGKNTRAILSGHRGMAEADMFTRLDELEEGDLIFIEVLNEKLAYQVTDRQVILPEQTEYLSIEDGEDMLTLVTCTPIYKNTHRLIVNAKRIDYIESMENSQDKIIFPKNPFVLITYLMPAITIGLLIYLIDDRFKRKRKENVECEKNKKV